MCHFLWKPIPPAYKTGLMFSDFWDAYSKVLPQEQHQATGKGENWYSCTSIINQLGIGQNDSDSNEPLPFIFEQ